MMHEPRPQVLLVEDDQNDAESVLHGFLSAGVEMPITVARDGVDLP